MRYQFTDDGETSKIRERPDKEILEKLPKLKFLKEKKNKISPDYEDKNIEKPQMNPKITDFSNSPTRESLQK